MVVVEALVFQRILDFENYLIMDGMPTEGNVARRFGRINAVPVFKPLPLAIDQRDERDWRTTDLGCKTRGIIEFRFCQCVENLILVQDIESGSFIVFDGGISSSAISSDLSGENNNLFTQYK